jgi:hypothetical protein
LVAAAFGYQVGVYGMVHYRDKKVVKCFVRFRAPLQLSMLRRAGGFEDSPPAILSQTIEHTLLIKLR